MNTAQFLDLPEAAACRQNKLGSGGWELVSAWLEMETAFPNFGDEKYVSGIQPNIRPQRVVMVLKRPIRKK